MRGRNPGPVRLQGLQLTPRLKLFTLSEPFTSQMWFNSGVHFVLIQLLELKWEGDLQSPCALSRPSNHLCIYSLRSWRLHISQLETLGLENHQTRRCRELRPGDAQPVVTAGYLYFFLFLCLFLEGYFQGFRAHPAPCASGSHSQCPQWTGSPSL